MTSATAALGRQEPSGGPAAPRRTPVRPAAAPAAIRLEGVEKVYRTERIETVALSDIDLEVGAGEFISIMGPSGCGKSTLLNLIGLLDVPTRRARHAQRRADHVLHRSRARARPQP